MSSKVDHYLPLFETKALNGRMPFLLYVSSVFVCICFICVYRVIHVPDTVGITLAWIGIFITELWFILYWFITLSVRWHPVYRYTFKERYSKEMPGVDIFVCTADPIIEPPIMVINTVLSVMAYDYPPEKLSVYLSDDGASSLTFYALLEASHFSKTWLPFCNKFKVEPRSPEAYFSITPLQLDDPLFSAQWSSIKNVYEEMKNRVESATKLGKISESIQREHAGFTEWDFVKSQRDHQTILQILIDGRDPDAIDGEGQPLPTIVYLSREKRPNFHHHFKAGAMNALIRVSSGISNGSIILNVDCDMYSNNSASVKDALCFFMDEEQGHNIAYVQFPQIFHNLTKNDIYGSALRVINKVDLAALDANGGPCYIGTGCFHRRDTLCGKIYDSTEKTDKWLISSQTSTSMVENTILLEEKCKVVANCIYEEESEWGKEMGLKYGCPVEDIITGLSIQCRGWKSVYFKPEREGFLGLAPTTLVNSLIQQKRWSQGDFQIFLSAYCPFIFGHKRIPLKLQLSYSVYLLWAANSFPTLYYVFVPTFCLLKGYSLFPKISSPWALPFACVFIAGCAYDFILFVRCGGTIRGWWNDLRMWMFKRTTSYLFGFCDAILNQLGIPESPFVITAKVSDEDASLRYDQEIMEFGPSSSPMLIIIATVAFFNLFSLVAVILKTVTIDAHGVNLDSVVMQIILCALLVIINLPVYQGSFFRKDKGRFPSSATYQSIGVSLLACSIALY